jgi:hypothetical protein
MASDEETEDRKKHMKLLCAVNRWYHPKRNRHNQQRLWAHFRFPQSRQWEANEDLRSQPRKDIEPNHYSLGIDNIPMIKLHADKGCRAHNPYKTIVG